ncbi:hypothetical protein GCM10023238_33490 [Streptomyces heliomycini]
MPPLNLGDDAVDAFLGALPGILDQAGTAVGKDDPENETTMSQEQDRASTPGLPCRRRAPHATAGSWTILNRLPVRSQSQLAKLLADDGLSVTQATLSRDLDELNAVKIATPTAT